MVRDGFKNLVANLGTGRDKQAGGDYQLLSFTDTQWETIYRVSWMGRKVVDIPAKDATRKWREWLAETDDITLLEKEEKRLRLPQRVTLALQQSRLFGGAGIYFSIKNDDPALPLDLDTVKQGSLEFLTVFPRGSLSPGDTETDPLSPDYGLPQWYEISSGSGATARIHRSRLVLFKGNELLLAQAGSENSDGWGDSVLMSAYEAVRNADSTASNIASLVYEAKVDVLQIPDLANVMADNRTRGLLEQRVVLSGALKGNNGMLIIDGDEEYSQKQFNFAGLPDISYQALQAVSGAADIPITRFLGQSPAGLSSTGESDLKNYYDAVNSMQSLVMTPAMERLDEVLIRSVFGNRPEDIDYQWSSLWQMSDEQKSKISLEVTQSIKNLVETALFPEDELAEAAMNVLVEHSVLPYMDLTARVEAEAEFEQQPPPDDEEEEDDEDAV